MATPARAIACAAFGPLAQLVVTEGLFWERVIRYVVGVPWALASLGLTHLPITGASGSRSFRPRSSPTV